MAIGSGQAPAVARTIDLTGRLVLPGLINGHTHIADAAIKEIGFGAPAGTNLFFAPDGLRYQALAALTRDARLEAVASAARHMLSCGVVAFADFTAGGAAGVAELREALSGIPIRALSFGGFAAPPRAAAVLEANTEGLDAQTLRDVAETLSVADGFAPVRASDLTDQAMAQVRSLAHDHGKPVAIHAGATPAYREVSVRRTGQSDVARIAEHLHPRFMVHLTDADESDLDIAATQNIGVVLCPRANATLGAGFPPYARAAEKGAVVGLGTDNLMLGSPDILAELNFVGRTLRATTGDPGAVDARTLLRAATIDGARAIGVDDTLGSLSVGKAASFVVVDLRRDSLAHSVDAVASVVQRATVADISAVVVDGEVVVGALD